MRCIPHGKWGLAQCKSTCQEHAGSDVSFENITLCLDQLLALSREANTLPQYKSSCKEQASYKVNQSFNCPFKLDIVLKLAHQLGPLEQTTNSSTLNHPILELRVVNTRAWRHYPNRGSYLHPNTVKNGNFRGLRRIWEFLPALRSVIILPPSQPRFLAMLPRWQWNQITGLLSLLQSGDWIVGCITSCEKYTSTLQWLTTLIFNTDKIWETFSPCGHGPAWTPWSYTHTGRYRYHSVVYKWV